MSASGRTLRAFPTLLKVGFADAVAYRAEFIVWVLAYTMPIIMLALWTAVAREAPVGRYGEKEFQAYFLATLIVRLATGSWVVWEMNMEVRQGTLQKRLLQPIHPIVTYLAENVAAMPMRLLVVTPIVLGTFGILGLDVITKDAVQLAIIPLGIVGAFLLTFFAMAAIGSLALYWESSLAVFDLWLGLYTVLSGYVMPLEFLPENVRGAVGLLPFRSMLAFPVENMLGLLSPARSITELGVQWAWVVFFVLLSRWLWNRGVRRFEAYGG